MTEAATVSQRRWSRFAKPILSVFLLSAALWALHHTLRGYHYRELAASFSAISSGRLTAAVGLAVLSYLALTGYDALAFRYIRNPLPYRKVALASFTGYAFANSTGSLSILTGGSVRYRLYAGWGLSSVDIAKLVAFCMLTFWLGFLTLTGLAFLLEPVAIPRSLHIPLGSLRVLGVLFLVLVAGYIGWSATRTGPVQIRSWEVAAPALPLSLTQLALSTADWMLSSSVLFVLLPDGPRPSFFLFLGLFLMAQVVGLASTVPGGLGVFESALVLLLAPFLPASSVVGPLIAFRAIYYLFPLFAAVLLLAVHEVVLRRETIHRAARSLGRPLTRVVPQILALGTFVGGAILLFSGATPTVGSRLAWLRHVLPLPVVEVSHFLGSLAGVGLLVLARGLQRRVDAAYLLAAALLATGIGAALLKGLDYEEALLLAALLSALLACRQQFYRRSSLTTEILSPRWLGAIGIVLAASIWLGFVAHRHVEYSGNLWWQFAFTADAPRFLRASVGAMVLVLMVVVTWFTRAARPRLGLPGAEDLEAAAAIARRSLHAGAYLALMGDKTLFFSPSRDAFLMYRVRGRSWVAMGDPVGATVEITELLWQFRDLCDRSDGWPVFYEVGAKHLPLYLDLGLTPLKIGEEGRVPLEGFSLAGSARKGLRAARNRVLREGGAFEVVPPQQVTLLLPELKRVSDAWLRDKNTREKGFSLGSFQEDYLRRFPCALVRKEGRIVAFANLWPGAGKKELSVDLMRFAPDAPHGTMDSLFAEILLWGKTQGYQCFNLGMAPLSGLENRAQAPLWSRMGAFLFLHGEHFYNFRGLRAYKEKFDPVWEPRYLVCPGGLVLPRVLPDVAALISGGVRGVMGK